MRLLIMPMLTGKTNVPPVDGPAVTDRNKHQAEGENELIRVKHGSLAPPGGCATVPPH
jgi:hypothetical protein